ncbi:MAG: O-antigen ligase family protein [Opitutaceae bacterium]
MSSSFAPAPLPSRSTLKLPSQKAEKPIWRAYLLGFIGVVVLVLFGGSHNVLALGVSLILPGVALFLRPPESGLGKRVDFAVVGFVACLLFAFVPPLFWSSPNWRAQAAQDFGIDLPSILSVQPWVSLEACFMAVAGLAWFYAATSWSINASGRKRLFVVMSFVVAGLASFVIWGNLYGFRYPGAEESQVFSFFENQNLTANFLVLAGVASFAFTIEGLRGRKLLYLIGAAAGGLCLAALILSNCRSGVFLFFTGIGVWFLTRLRAKSVPKLFKVWFPLVLIAFSAVIVSNSGSVTRIKNFLTAPTAWEQENRALIYQDSLGMFTDAPIFGHGVGTFAAVFPQYREHSRHFQAALHPESDVFWLVSEVGLLGTGLFIWFIVSYFLKCRGLSYGRSGAYRIIAFVAVVIFCIHSLVDVPGHHPGTVYFAILFAALALPTSSHEPSKLKPVIWRGLGVVLVLMGSVWFVSGLFNTPWHSSVAKSLHKQNAEEYSSGKDYKSAIFSIDSVISSHPLDWQSYFSRAQLRIASTGEGAEVDADFRRARFVEPTLGQFCVEEGFIWLPYDKDRAVSAWEEALSSELEDKEETYLRFLQAGTEDPDLMPRLVELSKVGPEYRAKIFAFLRGQQFIDELEHELAIDPVLGHFSEQQREEIIKAWIWFGDLDSVQAFIQRHEMELEDAWWFWSLIMKERADFSAAVDYARENMPIPEIPKVSMAEATLTRLSREFAVMPSDVAKGTALLSQYIDKENYDSALDVADAILMVRNPPAYIYYWRAEVLYQLGRNLESWNSFNAYMEATQADED